MKKSTFKKNAVYRAYFNFRDFLFRRQSYHQAIKIRLPFIQRYIPRKGVGAELGVLKGEFSKILWKYAEPQRLHLIDPFYLLTSHWDWVDGDKSTVSAARKVLKNFQKEIEKGQIIVHIEDDLQVLKSFPDGYLDWVYLDSSHTYAHTLKELDLLKHKLNENGIICGDDWHSNVDHRHYGVAKAVKEFAAKNKYVIQYTGTEDFQWAIKKDLD